MTTLAATPANIVEILNRHLKDETALSAADAYVDKSFMELGVESIGLAMAIFDLEDTFQVDIPFERVMDNDSSPPTHLGYRPNSLPELIAAINNGLDAR